MSNGFSLGAAIGATGRFPKLSVTEEKPDLKSQKEQDKRDEQLARIQQRVTPDENKYHPVYLGEATKETSDMILTFAELEKNKPADAVTQAYLTSNELNRRRKLKLQKSESLFGIEKAADGVLSGDRSLYVSRGVQELASMLRSFHSEESLKTFLEENPQYMLDGYLTKQEDESGGLILNFNRQPEINYEILMAKNKVLDLNKHGVLMEKGESDIPGVKGAKTIERFYGIPVNREEAIELAKKDKTVNIDNNAFDLGKKFFMNNAAVQKQFRSQLYWGLMSKKEAREDAFTMNDEQAYDLYFKNHILPNIPKKRTDRDIVERRTDINITNRMGDQVAPTSFQVNQVTMNYMGKPNNLVSKHAFPASGQAIGTKVRINPNRYYVNMETGLPDLDGSASRDLHFVKVGVFPCLKVIDEKSGKEFLLPVQEENLERIKKENPGKLLYMPFAVGTNQALQISQLPELGRVDYMVPLYEPVNGKWTIPDDVRKSKTIMGSPLLSLILDNNKFENTESRVNYEAAFVQMMSQVIDENDAVSGKKAPARNVAKPIIKVKGKKGE